MGGSFTVMSAPQTSAAVVFQAIPAVHGTRISALRAAADPAGHAPALEQLFEDACRVVADWNQRHPGLAVDLVVDVGARPLDTPRIDQAIRFALARSGLGGERLHVSAAGLSADPALRPVPADQLARLLLPHHLVGGRR